MAKIAPIPAPKRGRPPLPAAERKRMVAFRLSEQTIAQLAELAERLDTDKSDALRYAIAFTLAGSLDPYGRNDPADIKPIILATVRDLDMRRRYGGVVPLVALRAELDKRGISDREAVDAALVELEREYAVDLSIAQSPASLPPGHREQGIERPGHGLAMYVCPRQQEGT